MKVLFITNLPSPYRVDFFNELSKRCELTVCYERHSSTERDASWTREKAGNYREIFCSLRSIGTDRSIGFDLIRKVKITEFDRLVICGYASPAVILLIGYCKRKNIPYYIESDGGFNKKDKLFAAILKKSLLNCAAGIFTTCDELIRYYQGLGYTGKITKYPFSSFFKDEVCAAPANSAEKSQLRAELGMTENKIVLTVGRFSYMNGYGKGYDRVLQAAKKRDDRSIGWYIVGGKPTEEFIRLKAEYGLPNVHFVDFKVKDKLKKYYRAADLFVLMTVSDVWGLVINESMCYGLPVITTDRCIAGLEMVQNGENGYVIPVGDDEQLAEKVGKILSDDALRMAISDNNIRKITYWTIENMVDKHIEALKQTYEIEQR